MYDCYLCLANTRWLLCANNDKGNNVADRKTDYITFFLIFAHKATLFTRRRRMNFARKVV